MILPSIKFRYGGALMPATTNTATKPARGAGRPVGSNKEASLARILPAARKLFANTGYAKTTFKEVGKIRRSRNGAPGGGRCRRPGHRRNESSRQLAVARGRAQARPRRRHTPRSRPERSRGHGLGDPRPAVSQAAEAHAGAAAARRERGAHRRGNGSRHGDAVPEVWRNRGRISRTTRWQQSRLGRRSKMRYR